MLAPEKVKDKEAQFTFDHVYDGNASQERFYKSCVSGLVDAYLSGYNATILAYGQTGSGKTHTMGTASNAEVKEEDRGIVPRVIADMFRVIQVRTPVCARESLASRCSDVLRVAEKR